jgi:putative spermidine/putrescine transport system permease protein
MAATLRRCVLPIIAPSVIGIALFGFTLSCDEFARTLLAVGKRQYPVAGNFGMTTRVTTLVLDVRETLTMAFSFAVIICSLVIVHLLAAKRAL